MTEHSLGTIHIDENNIVRMNFKLDSEFTAEHAEEYFELWEKICGDTPRSFLYDFRKVFASLPHDFLVLISSDKRAFKWRKSEAVLIDSLSIRLMADFYKRLDTTTIPFKIFTDELKAIEWSKNQ